MEDIDALYSNLSIREVVGTPLPVHCLFLQVLVARFMPDDSETPRIPKTTIPTALNNKINWHIASTFKNGGIN